MDGLRSAIVTGAASDVGRAVVRQLLGADYQVLATDRTLPADVVAGENDGGRSYWLQSDLLREEGPAGLVERATAQFGRLDLVVNNAAVMRQATILKHTRADWDDILTVNARVPFELMQAAVPVMGAGSVIVNIVSLAAYRYTGPHLAYSASKSALLGMTREAACELAPLGIRVVGVAPGPTRSGMLDGIPADRLHLLEQAPPLTGINEPADVANVVTFLASPAAGRITGLVVPVTGGIELTVLHGEMQ